MAMKSVAVQERAGVRSKTGGLASSLVPIAAMGVVIALATLLLTIILTSPATHGNLLP
ncbi:MAG: hypothetical protein HYX97_03810 [Chloroflexi bacterium]|nr:hypothetical protein [Chloroflexota bacterium]